jgi:alkylation response protein AidB-like acyl-CoA dehydrogenase
VTGDKRYSTLAPVADTLLVVASEGTDASGRNRLRVVRLDARARGVNVRRMPDIPFAPEVPHAEVRFDEVTASVDAVLPGDGYAAYLKPFRTVEDVHVHGALLGYVASVARRCGWPETLIEAIASLVVTARSLALADPSRPELHVALSGWLAESAALLERAEEHWARADEPERARWQRDRALSAVARGVREQRRARAWEILREGEKGRTT